MNEWREEDVLVTVRAYPEPSAQYGETSCVAGVTLGGDARRLFPIPGVGLPAGERFKKYNVVRVRTKPPSSDHRPESRRIDFDHGIEVVDHYDTKLGWQRRNDLVAPIRAPSMEAIEILDPKQVPQSRSLALIRPKSVDDFLIEQQDKTDWDDRQRSKLAKLAQKSLLQPQTPTDLEFIPYKFYYRFRCDDASCGGHRKSVIDWELGQSYRKWSRDYGDRWPEVLREKYFDWMLKRDLQFYVGTMSQFPTTWIIIGLYYPPLEVANGQPALFP